MEYIIVLITLIIILIITAIVYNLNPKEVKKMAKRPKIDEIVNKMPDNIEVCKSILKKINNEDVKIEEDKNASNCLYIAMTNKILIGNLRNSYTRIQTIAHECLHSIQNKKILKFNFIYSNIYLIYFFIISVLAIGKWLPYKMIFLNIFIFLSYIYYFIRSYLENDAMIKAEFLAKEYMQESKILSNDEIEEVTKEYQKLNNIGIKFINYDLMFKTILKVIIFLIICIIR